MSDLILKFWPKVFVEEGKVLKLRMGFLANNIIGKITSYWGKKAFEVNVNIYDFLGLKEGARYEYPLLIRIAASDYGVLYEKEELMYVDRKNVLLIYKGDGQIIDWSSFCNLLNEITGDVYEGGWEIL